MYIVELSKTAQMNVAPPPAEDDAKMPETITKKIDDESVSVKSNDKGKRKAPCPSSATEKKQKAAGSEEIAPEYEVEESDVEEEILNDTDTKEIEETEAELVDFARDYLPAETETPQQFDPKSWNFNVPPMIPDIEFTGKGGIQHTLSPEFSSPFDYFSLFIPVHFYTKWSEFTNLKANQVCDQKEGNVRYWRATNSAEIKGFFAAAIWYSLLCKATFTQHIKKDIDQDKLSFWFSSPTRWEQIKRYLKLSDPTTDSNFKEDRMHRIRELFDHFISACKANFQPSQCLALDEAMKKFKVLGMLSEGGH
jgi:hypothetical protein